ncbi:hypothetical protein DCAR_0830953 [Daucus carota subsp. sativus]|uniref:ATP synthase protein MI25 n=1 Tax=Daucus carota subsp. sativus TaxID=79200 RepID=A0AAF1BCR3_DAUCS|nr:hypothetical protein DCAR_0830953 [Daucus carota subsp. sativus]
MGQADPLLAQKVHLLVRKKLNPGANGISGRIQVIQEESQQFPNPNEVVPPESNEQQRLLRISLRICGTVVEVSYCFMLVLYRVDFDSLE